MSGARGLTLIEVLGAVALVGLLAAAAWPQYGRMLARWRLNTAARQVVMDLKLVRARAIGEATRHRLRFEVPGRAYHPERRLPSGSYEAAGPWIPLPPSVDVIGCTATGAGVGFQPRGMAATFGTVTLRNDEGDQRLVIVDIVGRMRVE